MKKNLNRIRKLAIVLAALILLVSSISAQSMATDFGVNDTSGDSNTFVKVPVNITDVNNESIAGIIFDISFNSSVINLTKDGVQKGDLTSAWDSPRFNPNNGRISIVYSNNGTEISKGRSGSVVILNFSVVGVPGAKSAMNISRIQLSDLSGALGTASARNGTFTIEGQQGAISGMKFNDSNGNGIKDPEDVGIANWTTVLKNSTSIVKTITTDLNGNYTFNGLAAGNYTVEEVLSADWKQTFPEAPGIYNVTLAAGESVTGIDFGNNIMPPLPSGVNATREIEKESLSPGESTNITVTISSDVIQALVLQESIPAGWKLTRISDDVDGFKNSTNEWAWSNVTPGIAKTVAYSIASPIDASLGTYYINGTISNSSGIVAVGGNNIITLDILTYYRKLGSDPDRVETTDLLKAMDDWRTGTAPAGFANPITSLELSALIDEWTRT